jgi:hypothetical protein
MSIEYAAEKFGTAVAILATHTGGIIDRLTSAYLDSLIRVEPEDIPESLQSDYVLLLEKLNWLVKDEGSPPSPDEGSMIANSILELSFRLDLITDGK